MSADSIDRTADRAGSDCRPAEARVRTAAALVIGNELLSGKIEERNVPVLARELFGLGILLRRVVVCPDEIGTIAEDLRALADRHDHVFTSGGVGPTHDDVTIAAVARCFDRPVVRSERLETLLRGFFRDRFSDGHLRMADVPEGAELLTVTESDWPAVRIDNVFVLPGLPEIFRLKMPILRRHLGADRPFVSRRVRSASDEGEIADLLDGLDQSFPDVSIGSYPQWGRGPVRVEITFDGHDREQVEAAVAALLAGLPAGHCLDEPEPADEPVIDESSAATRSQP